MDQLVINGPSKLSGSVKVSCAKNACLPILAGVLLNPKPTHLKNLPDLRDIRTMCKLLEMLGVKITKNGSVTTFDASELTSTEATYELVKTMRASIFVLGPLMARKSNAKVSLPGGCAIGARPIDLHLTNLEKMGAAITLEEGYVKAEGKMTGTHLVLAFPSVGATENLLMAAVLADGKTTIENCALEPEITDLANFLNKMGARIEGIGTKTLVIDGVMESELCELEYEAIGDRIEASTYVMAALATQSTLTVEGFNPQHIEFITEKLIEMGANIKVGPDFMTMEPSTLKGVKIDTAPYPGFPTDAQAQIMALACLIDGNSLISENIFENRFMHVPELKRLGARITIKGNSTFVEGGFKFTGAPVMATDLRASAALIIAALAAKGTTTIRRVYHLDRGYADLDNKLRSIGVDVRRENPELENNR